MLCLSRTHEKSPLPRQRPGELLFLAKAQPCSPVKTLGGSRLSSMSDCDAPIESSDYGVAELQECRLAMTARDVACSPMTLVGRVISFTTTWPTMVLGLSLQVSITLSGDYSTDFSTLSRRSTCSWSSVRTLVVDLSPRRPLPCSRELRRRRLTPGWENGRHPSTYDSSA